MTELRKTGIKMKAETETAYEPDILVLMERMEDVMNKKKNIWRVGTVLKDRYRVIDGKSFKNPTYKDFEKMIEKALDGAYRKKLDENRDSFDDLKSTSNNWQKKRDVALEEIENIFPQLLLSTSKDDKAIKLELLKYSFDCTSWTKIKSLPVETLEGGLEQMKVFKALWIDYLKRCNEDGTQIDKQMAYEYMRQVYELDGLEDLLNDTKEETIA